jgi:hypothetical protein
VCKRLLVVLITVNKTSQKVTYRDILISLTNFMDILNSMRMLYNTSLLTKLYIFFLSAVPIFILLLM